MGDKLANDAMIRRAYKKALSKGSLMNSNMIKNDSSMASFMEMLVDLAGGFGDERNGDTSGMLFNMMFGKSEDSEDEWSSDDLSDARR